MIKFIVILILLLYLLNKVSVILFRVVGGSRSTPPPNFRKPPEGTINMEGGPKKPSRKGGGLKGGEYVDYEEVK
jgi:hypothetical protein